MARAVMRSRVVSNVVSRLFLAWRGRVVARFRGAKRHSRKSKLAKAGAFIDACDENAGFNGKYIRWRKTGVPDGLTETMVPLGGGAGPRALERATRVKSLVSEIFTPDWKLFEDRGC
jgi:hypothetical protein